MIKADNGSRTRYKMAYNADIYWVLFFRDKFHDKICALI